MIDEALSIIEKLAAPLALTIMCVAVHILAKAVLAIQKEVNAVRATLHESLQAQRESMEALAGIRDAITNMEAREEAAAGRVSIFRGRRHYE